MFIKPEILCIKKGDDGYTTIVGKRPLGPDTNRQKAYASYFADFETDIRRNGYRNPALLWSLKDGTYCLYGNTRAWLAKKCGFHLPAIICDWEGRWSSLEELETVDQALSKFTDEPAFFAWEPGYLNFYNWPNEYDESAWKSLRARDERLRQRSSQQNERS